MRKNFSELAALFVTMSAVLALSSVEGLGQSAQSWFINRRAVATNYTVTSTDWYIAATASQTNSLPAVASVRNGQAYIIKNVTSGNTVTVRPSGGNTIDGVVGDLVLTNQQQVAIIGNGASNWEKVMSFNLDGAGSSSDPLWTNISNVLQPTAGNEVLVTNLSSQFLLRALGAFTMPSSLSSNLVAGTNCISPFNVGSMFVTGPTTNASDASLSLSAGQGQGQFLVIENHATNSAFTMFNGAPWCDGSPDSFLSLRGDWTPSTFGDAILLFNTGTIWTELARASGDTNNPAVTINPTDGRVPYRQNSTTFQDSSWFQIRTNAMGFNFTNRFISFVGDGSLPNMFLGYDAGNLTTSGSFNIGIGKSSLDAITSGLQNVAVGDLSCDNIADGTSNVSFGVFSLRNNISGNGNTAIGHAAMLGQLGDQGTALGSNAGIHATNSSDSVVMGFRSGYFQTNIVDSVIIGSLAQTNSAGSWTNVISIGKRAFAPTQNTTAIGNTNTTTAYIFASGFANSGTKFLSDDGTYKSAGGNSPSVEYLDADETEATTTPNSLALSVTVTAAAKYAFTLTVFMDNSTDVDGACIDFDGGTATMTSFRAQTKVFDSALALSSNSTALATDLCVATLTGTGSFEVSGGFTVNAGGTFIPRFFLNAATTGTLTAFRNSTMTVTAGN